MKSLQIGNDAPELNMLDMDAKEIRLSDYQGQKVLLVFFRYATCPFCTVRFAGLSREVENYAKQGIKIIGVFESSREYIQEYLGRRGLPFPVIPDPEGVLYARYGLKKSFLGLLMGMFRMPTLFQALFDSKYRMAKPDASMTRLPADFLIDSQQVIGDVYYGRDIGDHIPYERIC